MKYIVHFCFYMIIFILFPGLASSQTVINKVWETINGTPDTIDATATCFDQMGNLVVTGNTFPQVSQLMF